MPLYFQGGGAGALGYVTAAYDPPSDVLSGIAYNPDGSLALSRPVRVYRDGAGSATFTATSNASTGAWSVSAATAGDGLAHTFSIQVDLVSTVATAIAYAPAFSRVHFDGATYARVTAGANASADTTAITATFVSGGVDTLTFTGGGNWDPGVVQTITKTSGSGSGLVATVAARSDGKLYGADVTYTNRGTGFSGTPVFNVTRKCQKFIFAFRFKPDTTIANNDCLFNFSSGFGISFPTVSPVGTGYRLSQSGTITTAYAANMLSQSALKTVIMAVDLSLPYASGGLAHYQDDVAYTTAPATYVQGNSIEMSNVGTPNVGVFASNTGTTILEGTIEYLYGAWGLPAIDLATGALLDITQQSVRNRFLSGAINLANGSGPTGRSPQWMFDGTAASFLTNKGIGAAMAQTGTGLTDA